MAPEVAEGSSTEEELEAGDVPVPKYPQAVSALQASAHLATLPYKVRRRVKALKKLQMEATELEAKFFQEVYALECKYHKTQSGLYSKRAQITDGKHEPTDEESVFPLADTDSEDEEKITEVNEDGTPKEDEEDKNVKGIPSFWLTIFQTEEMLCELVGDDDMAVIEKLFDITLEYDEGDKMGFTLSFHFHPNENFTDSVLTKHYTMKCQPDKDDPFGFEGPEISGCSGCKIHWKEGKNLTVKQVKKKVKKGKDKGKTITKEVKADSFFNFFSPPSVPEDPDTPVDEDVEMHLQQDYEIGHYLRERVIPRAVLFYTGEEQEDSDDDDDDEELDEEEESEDDMDEDQVDRPKLKARKGKNKMATDAPECKQQ